MRKLRFNVFVVSALMLVSFSLSNCDFINSSIFKNNTPITTQPSPEELKEQRKQDYRDNIAKYVQLHIDDFNGKIYIYNNTEYTLESVTIELYWTMYDRDMHEDLSYKDTRTFTLIPAKGESTKISFGYEMKNVRGQITSIKCGAIGFY